MQTKGEVEPGLPFEPGDMRFGFGGFGLQVITIEVDAIGIFPAAKQEG